VRLSDQAGSKYDPAKVRKYWKRIAPEMAALIPVEGRAAQIGDIAVVDFLKGW